MRCPVCSSEETKVVDSRIAADGLGIRRRRECESCEYRFSTVEEVEILDLAVVKRDGHRQPYLREKIEAGLRRALEKRPCTPEQFKSLIGGVERDIQKLKKDEVTSEEIGEIVMSQLRAFDTVAYIRFASVYRSFADVKTFQEELDRLVEKETRGKLKKKATA
jgi:transcriptional repressor NrdR